MTLKAACHRSPVAVLAVPALVAVALALGSGASAQDPGARTLTIRELDKGSIFTHIRNTKRKSSHANAQGDLLAFTIPLADESGDRVGKLSFSCATTTGAPNPEKSTVTCVGVAALRDGSLMVQTNINLGRSKTVGAVTGGTGAYANARGVVVSQGTKSGAVDTFTLAD
jgi:hypothetical protein